MSQMSRADTETVTVCKYTCSCTSVLSVCNIVNHTRLSIFIRNANMPKSGLNTSKVSSSAQSIASVSKLRARGEGYVRPPPPPPPFPFL